VKDIAISTFEMVYKNGIAKKPSGINEPRLFIGLYGFEFSSISRVDTLWCRPSDTLVQPCVHNLLSDIFIRNLEFFEIADPSVVKLFILDLSKDRVLRNKLAASLSSPPGVKDILYLVMNIEMQETLPAMFTTNEPVLINILNPPKFPRSKETMAMTIVAPAVAAGQIKNSKQVTATTEAKISTEVKVADKKEPPVQSKENTDGPVNKLPFQLTVLDKQSLRPINDFYLSPKLKDILYSYKKFNSGDVIPGMVNSDSIRYLLRINHPDYLFFNNNMQLISGSELANGMTVYLDREPAFNFIYIIPEQALRSKIMKIVKKRLSSINELDQPFFLFISNAGNPVSTSDPRATNGKFEKMLELFPDDPKFSDDYTAFASKLNTLQIEKDSKIVLQIYLSNDCYQDNGKQHLARIINAVEKVYGPKPRVFIYTDSEIPNAGKINPTYTYLNLINE
jgi:hypothetical protein